MSVTIFYILPYLTSPHFEKLRHERIYRERQIVLQSRKLGYKSDLLLPTFGSKEVVLPDDCGSRLYPVSNHRTGNKFNYISMSLLERIEQDKPDLVVFKGMGYRLSRWLMLNCKHRFRFAFITAGGTKDVLASYADFILAETHQQVEEKFQEQQSQGRVAILPKLNLPDSFQHSERKDFDIINVGSFNTNKNQEALIPLARDCRLALIGDGPLFSKVKEALKPFKHNVYMPGNLPRDKIPRLIAHSRLMVHPAHHEGLARVVMEAFACGVPVVASEKAMPNAFRHGVHGLLVEPDEIIPATKELLSDNARLQHMGNKAYEYARENCTAEAVFKEIQGMLDKVLSEPPVFMRHKCDLLKLRIQSAGILVISYMKRVARFVGQGRLKKIFSSKTVIFKNDSKKR